MPLIPPLPPPPIQPVQPLNLGQHELQQLLAANQVQVATDARVLAREAVEAAAEHRLAELGLDLAREAGVKVVEHLDVEEEHRHLRELGGDGVEEHLGAVVLVVERLALPRLDGQHAHVDDVGAVAEEDGFAAWEGGGLVWRGRGGRGMGGEAYPWRAGRR